MRIKIMAIIATLLFSVNGCATQKSESVDGPGMVVTFISTTRGKDLLVRNAISASGKRFPNPGGLSPQSRPITNGNKIAAVGATMGAAPDGRQLPEWVEFTWVETDSTRDDYKREELHALPEHKERVAVRDRVPPSVIAEIMESNRHRERGKVSKKMLWVYFIWTANGIKFRWELKEDGRPTVQVGGDDISSF